MSGKEVPDAAQAAQAEQIEELRRACFDVSGAVIATHLAEIVHRYVPENLRDQFYPRIRSIVKGAPQPAAYCIEVESGNEVVEILLQWAYVDTVTEDRDRSLFHEISPLATKIRGIHAMYKDFLVKFWEYIQKTESALITDLEKYTPLVMTATDPDFRMVSLAKTPRHIRFLIVVRDKK